jgi:hypothetical protein
MRKTKEIKRKRELAAIEFKKGGACLLRIDGPEDEGSATLQWLVTPALLRALVD